MNYSVVEKLLFSLVTTVRRLRPYFQAHPVSVVTDKPLKVIIQKPDASGRLVKWAIELSGYEIDFVPRTAVKTQALADFIADFAPVDAEEDRSEEDIEEPWRLFTDGSSGEQYCGAGVYLQSPEGLILQTSIRFYFHPTNNEAEYEGVLAGLRLANALGVKHLHLCSDSQLVVNQILHSFSCQKDTLLRYLDLVRVEIARFHQFSVSHVPREQNEMADLLSRGEGPSAVVIHEVFSPSIEEKEVAMVVEDEESWMTPVIRFLQTGVLPSTAKEARALKFRAARYFLWEGFLYKKSHSGISLKCVHPGQTEDILAEVHSGECGSHAAGSTLAHRILRQGFYWPTLVKDASDFAKKCLACQHFGREIHQPAQPLQPIISPWPFAMWGMDFVGPFPMGSGQRQHLLVLIDYFTKWVEAVAVPKATTEAVIKFLDRDIFCRFGLPMYIVTDNGTPFASKKLGDFCQKKGVTLKFASVSHPQTNGQAEAANRLILSILKRRLNGCKGLWADELPSVLWAYRTSVSTVTKESPFSLAFGMEAMTPAELLVPSGRVKVALAAEEGSVREWEVQNSALITNSLDLLEEKRLRSQERVVLHKQRAVRFLSRSVRLRSFQQGDLVLRKASSSSQSDRGKLSRTWDGPFIIKRVAGPGAYQLQNSEGTDLPRTWSSADLKIFYS